MERLAPPVGEQRPGPPGGFDRDVEQIAAGSRAASSRPAASSTPPTSTDGSDQPSGDGSSGSGDGITRRVYRTRDARPPYARRVVDLRSDTVTRPTPEMRRAMADAEVGDDGYGEDPTVRALEEAFAARVGKPAARLRPERHDGQPARRCASWPAPAPLVLAGRRSHIVAHEDGAAGLLNAGVQLHPLPDDDGAVVGRRRGLGHRRCPPTTGRCPGCCAWRTPRCPPPAPSFPLETIDGSLGGSGCPVHLDGARLWNAEVASGMTRRQRSAAPVTTVMCCLSKGLCAPVGSLLAGPGDVIDRGPGLPAAARRRHAPGRRHRRRRARRPDDDGRAAGRGPPPCARLLAEAVAERWPDAREWVEGVRTNIVTFPHPDTDALIAHLAAHGVLAGTIAPGVIRLVTHHDVDDVGDRRRPLGHRHRALRPADALT